MKYLEQWERVKRWHARLQNFNSFKTSATAEEVQDNLYAFFLNCYHLKDWLKQSFPEKSAKVEALYDKNKGVLCLKICADMTNANKHTRLLERTARSNNHATSILSISATRTLHITQPKTLTPPMPGIRWSFDIFFDDKKYDAYEVANQCMEELEKYLKTLRGL